MFPDYWWLVALATLALAALAAVVTAAIYFGRDPRREIIPLPNSILSAADGWISVVKKITYDDLPKQIGVQDLQDAVLTAHWNHMPSFWLISVFMSATDVHINRAPVSGTLTSMVHRPGQFLPLSATETENQRVNEQNAMFIQGQNISAVVVQIAGLLARRIVCNVSLGDTVRQGEKLGSIRLGSQTDVIFPALSGMVVEVRKHSKVKAGIDPLASLNYSSRHEADDSSELPGPSWGSGILDRILERYLVWTLLACLYVKKGARSVARVLERHAHGGGE